VADLGVKEERGQKGGTGLLSPVETIELGLAGAVLLLLAGIPFVEIIIRKVFQTGVPGSYEYILHLVLWVTFVGGMVTTREKGHLALTAGLQRLKGGIQEKISVFNNVLTMVFTFAFFWSSLSFLVLGFDPSMKVGFLPIQLVVAIIPAGFLVMSLHFFGHLPKEGLARIWGGLGLVLGTLISIPSITNMLSFYIFPLPEFFFLISDAIYTTMSVAGVPLVILLILSAFTGTPIFIVLGGIAYILFSRVGAPPEVIPNEGYVVLTSDTIPAIPLFTVTGFILSESKAGERLVHLFRTFFGWVPGGLVIVAVLVSAFFTTFTGASGVTILALGALLSYALVNSGRYTENFSNGLLTASGSIGLLFPPSLPIIMYAVMAQISVKEMFLGGILPGVLMVLALSAVGVVTALRGKVKRVPFSGREALSAMKDGIGEVLLPVIIILAYFGGFTTLIETGALAVVYTLVLEVFIKRDLRVRDLLRVVKKCTPIIGGILIILAVAKGLSYYIVDTEAPLRLSEWVGESIQSKYVFLILLNIVLLITGCLMDIFSAIMVVVPLIIPLGEQFGIHPVHLGIIFLANLELGYLTPPVGLNLFLASYRFEKPLSTIYRNVIPFFIILLVTVLLITYVPWFSLSFVGGP
jgi:C4-dicarboxylate transporter, DctM subunit